MSKLGCQCGSIIADNSDNLPHKSRFIRDEDYHVRDKTIVDICSFMEAYKNGEKEKWLKSYFGNETNINISNEWILIYIGMKNEEHFEDIIYQCENCGRVKIETSKENEFASFIPESGNWKNIFKGKTKDLN